MADFRKLLLALAMVTLFAGLSAAQTTPMTCTANAGVPPIVRSEGFAEMVGDLILICTGGTPTPNGQAVPPVNFTVFLTTNITSNPLSGIFNEALLIIDDPNSPQSPNTPLLNCGALGAPDNSPSGPGVCSITSIGNAALTYDGTPQGYPDSPSDDNSAPNLCGDTGVPAASTFGCGRPNVFQGRQGIAQNPGINNAVTFNGVPLDPPGDNEIRIIRITNIRADAELLGVSATFNVTPIVMNISVSGQTSLAINNPQQTVAYIQRGLQDLQVQALFDYIQCLEEELPSLSGIVNDAYDLSILAEQGRRMYVRFREGFANSWKVKGWEHMEANGSLQNVNDAYRRYDIGDTGYPTTVVRQNVPGAIYNTESGFNAPPSNWPAADPEGNINPPVGVGTVDVPLTGQTLTDGYSGHNLAIEGAGVANQGTRLVLSFQPNTIPAGSTVWVPSVVYITRDGTNVVTGVAVRTNTTSNGGGAYSRTSTGGATTWTSIGSDLIAVYEVLFDDPFSIEALTVPVGVSYVPNLSQNRPDPTVTARVGGGFAPFYDPGPTPRAPSATLPEPRFIPGQTPRDLFRINKCACNLLFPYVTNARACSSAFDTGIALANTSLDPGANFGFTAVPQEGAVRFWYYNTAPPPGGANAPQPQCTNVADPGGQNGTVCNTKVPAGAVLTYVLSKGSAQWGLDPRAANFTGYMIAQADFQYCHAFAYVSAQDAGPTTPGMSVGYVALVLDKGYELQRTLQTLSDNLSH